jgi:transcriptional regulator with XRE-family HTH domain
MDGKKTPAGWAGAWLIIDSHLGSRMRVRREALGMSQRELAEALGLSLAQVRKYEAGARGIRSSRLYAIAKALDVSVSFFFEDSPTAGDERSAANFDAGEDAITSRETSALLRAYWSIPDRTLRRKLGALFRAAAEIATPKGRR